MSRTTAPSRARRPGHGQRGFSLIEIMVGLVIAMIGVIIMMEVLITSEERTRTTNSGNDAMSSGAVTSFMMQADLLQAGYGMNAMGLLGCNLQLPNGTVVPIAPVVINPVLAAALPAKDANTDSVLVMYGNDNSQPEGNPVVSYDAGASQYTMQAAIAFNKGDWVIEYPGSCAANLKLAQVTDSSTTTVTVDNLDTTATALYNLGQSPKVVGYMVRSGSLTSCDFRASDCTKAVNWAAVAGNVVSLRAQYGRDTSAVGAMDGTVDVWDQTTPTTACTWARATAVRFGLVARSTQFETQIDKATGQRVCDAVTTNVPTWAGSSSTPAVPFVAPFSGTTGTDWQCYRYRTFENVAPTRNIVWMGTQAGC